MSNKKSKQSKQNLLCCHNKIIMDSFDFHTPCKRKFFLEKYFLKRLKIERSMNIKKIIKIKRLHNINIRILFKRKRKLRVLEKKRDKIHIFFFFTRRKINTHEDLAQ